MVVGYMLNVRVRKTFKGLTIEFIDLLDKPLFQEINTAFIELQLEDAIYKDSEKKIRDLIPLHYTFLNNHYDLSPQKTADLEEWFNQQVEELLKNLGEEEFEELMNKDKKEPVF
jgi:hypothetical protein